MKITGINVTIAPSSKPGLAQVHWEVRNAYREDVFYSLESLYPDAFVVVRMGDDSISEDLVEVVGVADSAEEIARVKALLEQAASPPSP